MNPYDDKHIKRINRYLGKINGHFDDLVREISLLAVKQKVSDKLFRFKDYKTITNRVEEILKKYENNLISSIKVYSQYEWDFANAKVDDILKTQLESIKGKVPSSLYVEKIRQISKESQNQKAFEAFQERKIGKFTISERVWNITNQAKENLEFAIDVALKEGISAQELARRIKGNLNNPDALFRKVRDKHGNLVLSQNAKYFHPGQGVYRSAHKNALRLAANEINTAYRESEQLRISTNNDVVGVKISLSPQHSVRDICDDLVGIYPKDFQWHGFHIACKCYRTTILKTPEELISEINEGLNLPPKSSRNFVADVPDNFNKWVNSNADKMEKWRSKPSFITENKKFDPEISKLINKAQKASPEMDRMITDVLGKYGGYATPLNFKSRDSIYRKVTTELGGNVSGVKDAVRATIVLPIKDYQKFEDNLKKSGIFDKVKYQKPSEYSGYSGIITNFKTSNGITAEIQFNTDKMIYAKEKPADAIRIMGEKRWREIEKETGLKGGLGHEYYEKFRVLSPNDPKRLDIEKLSIEYYKNFR